LGVYPDGLGEHCDGDACGGSANINSATKFVQHYGYWEYSVKWPPNVPGASGEDHDFWLALDGTDSGCNNGIDQINMDENSNGGNGVAGTGSQYSDQLSVSDCTSNGIPNYIVFGHTGADFSAGFHTFGMSWLPKGTKNGIITFYIDGIQQGQYQLSNTGNAWANGLYTIVSNSYCAAGGILGGGPCTGDGTHPTQVKYVRVWQVSRTPRGQQ
jgi:hypothetical protein